MQDDSKRPIDKTTRLMLISLGAMLLIVLLPVIVQLTAVFALFFFRG